MRGRFGVHLRQAAFQELAVKIHRIYRRFRVTARAGVIVSVSHDRNLAALAFRERTQSTGSV
jgi:hypothetical protein